MTSTTATASHSFKVGDKVIPHGKTTGCSLSESGIWYNAQRQGQSFLYISEIKGDTLWLAEAMGRGSDRFNYKDVTPYHDYTSPLLRTGWTLSGTSLTNASSIKEMKYNSIFIQGRAPLMKAFESEIEALGLKFNSSFPRVVYGSSGAGIFIGAYELLKKEYSHYSNIDSITLQTCQVTLPADYDRALAWIKEQITPPKPTTVAVTVGTPAKVVEVSKDKFTASNFYFSPSDLTQLQTAFGDLKPLSNRIHYQVRSIWVGCSGEGTLLELEDIHLLKSTQAQLL